MSDYQHERASCVALTGAFVYHYPVFLPLLEEHLEENYEMVLGYLVVADVVRWLVEHREDEPDLGRQVVTWMEAAYTQADEPQRDLIGAGFVEALPNPGDEGSELRDYMGPNLRSVDPWDPRWARQQNGE